MIANTLQDLRYAVRALVKSPRFSLTAVLTLALGIAANVAIFTFVNAALIRPLPYHDAGRLVEVYSSKRMDVNQQFEASYPDYLDWRNGNKVFESLAGYSQNGVILKGRDKSEPLPSAVASDNFFQTLGVKPLLGRDFRAGEDLATAPRTVLLSYGFWQRHFGGRSDAIGATLNLDGQANTIIGVLPSDFHFAPVGDPDVWLTLHASGDLRERRNLYWVSVVGRLKPGVSMDAAASGMNVVAEQLERQYPQSNQNLRTAVVPLADVIVGAIRPILIVLLAAVGLLLLIACANIANLLLARSIARRREMAIRSALGASRARLAYLVLSEGVSLSILGGILGIFGSQWLVHGFLRLIPLRQLQAMPYLKNVSTDATVLIFAFCLSVITGIFFALAPAFRASRSDVQNDLKENTRSSQSGGWKRFASALVVAEVTIAMVLLVGSGLLIKSLYRLLTVDPGFEHDRLTLMTVVFPDGRYPKEADQLQLHHNLIEQLRAVPGVESAGSSTVLPVSNGGNTIMFCVEGRPCDGRGVEANIRDADQTYLQTLRAQLVQGRWFTDSDNLSAPNVVVVNETLARKYLNGTDPLKQSVRFTYSAKEKPRQIIGVLKDIKEGPLDSPARPAIYTPLDQSTGTFFNIAVRSSRDPATLIPELEKTVLSLDANAVAFGAQTMNERIQRSPAAFLHRYPAWLAGGFALLALLLGTIGLYGLVAYSVSQRTQEFGIRMALGAKRSHVLNMVLAQGLRLIVPGIVIGAVVAVVAAYLVRNLLFGVTVADPLILAAVTVLLAAVTMFASFIPARQATKVDPMVALRYE
ncbi:MAG TPA: ABC transporter permease [Candidatus Angelobacter sp.]|jgi:macrolide transport system ATP-binding/permease protein|nr:ABC transporter permease [Candidatus Angelobacter sp.]